MLPTQAAIANSALMFVSDRAERRIFVAYVAGWIAHERLQNTYSVLIRSSSHALPTGAVLCMRRDRVLASPESDDWYASFVGRVVDLVWSGGV
jgi:hypothetical protein